MQENLNCAGIYKITCTKNNKFYIGSSNHIRKRFNYHRSLLRRNKHHSKYLQNCFNKYGNTSLNFELVQIIDDIDNLRTTEQYYIDNLKPSFNSVGLALGESGYKLPKNVVDSMINAQHKRSNETVLSNNTTGHTGISFHKKQKKFNAFITINSTRRVNLGSYNSIEDAILARKEGESLYWNEDFSKLSKEDQDKVLDHNSLIRLDMKNSVPQNKFIQLYKPTGKWLLTIRNKKEGWFLTLEDATLIRNSLLKLPTQLEKFAIKHFALDLTRTCTSSCA